MATGSSILEKKVEIPMTSSWLPVHHGEGEGAGLCLRCLFWYGTEGERAISQTNTGLEILPLADEQSQRVRVVGE